MSKQEQKPDDPYDLHKLTDDELVELVKKLNAHVAACLAEVKRRLDEVKLPKGDLYR